jgi:molybdate transport system substrate-binding protein
MLRILSAGSTLHGLRACKPQIEQTAGPCEIATDHGHNIVEKVKRGEADADAVVLPADMIDELTARGLVRGKTMLGTVGIGGVIREDARVPDISTMDLLRKALFEADAVLLTLAPTGDHLIEVIGRLDLGEKLAARIERFDTSTKLNLALAARSDNALGFGPETEIRAGTGVRWIGDVPDEIQIALPYAAAMLSDTRARDAAERLLGLLTTATARKAFARTGVRF